MTPLTRRDFGVPLNYENGIFNSFLILILFPLSLGDLQSGDNL